MGKNQLESPKIVSIFFLKLLKSKGFLFPNTLISIVDRFRPKMYKWKLNRNPTEHERAAVKTIETKYSIHNYASLPSENPYPLAIPIMRLIAMKAALMLA